MKLAVLKERASGEARVAATPETVKKFTALGFSVDVEAGSGDLSFIPDAAYSAAGASISHTALETIQNADIILKVVGPDPSEIALLPRGVLLVGMLKPYADKNLTARLASAEVTAFALELMPRITRAQSMDVLSSQSNLAGYRAVIEAASSFGRAFPMMMTAAGTVAPAKVLVMGAGVAGLQAIATARRLGAVVSATDVRPSAKEQVESLGARFITVADDEPASKELTSGYATEMSEAYKKKQAILVADTLKNQDIVITTALVPGKTAPLLITQEMVFSMRGGSVIVDLAAEQGGNCALTQPGETIKTHGITIVGSLNAPSQLATDASSLYSHNLYNFILLLVDKEKKKVVINFEDEILKSTCLTHNGRIVHPQF